MKYLERLDARHRREKIDQFDRLRQVPPATGKFLAMLAAGAPHGSFLEIGTSGGYSGLWLSLACRAAGKKLTTFEMDKRKISLARETFREAGIDDVVNVVEGDARKKVGKFEKVAFCFLDAEKGHYQECFDMVVPNLVRGGLLVADNVLSHQEALAGMVRRTLRDGRVDSMIVPIGSGLLLCRKI
jgi:predicted O-methyltransferase YrrM